MLVFIVFFVSFLENENIYSIFIITKLLKLGQLKSTSALKPVPALRLTCVVSD